MIIGLIGTLIVMIPFVDGVVIASDSRTFNHRFGVYCDDKNKILIPSRPSRTVVALTGTSSGSTVPAGVSPEDACDLRNQRTVFDIGQDIVSFLEKHNKSVPEIDIAELISVCLAQLKDVAARYPKFVEQYADRVMFTLVLISHDPDSRITHVRTVAMGFTLKLEPAGFPKGKWEFAADGSGYLTFGNTTYAFKNEALRFLSDEAKKFESERPRIRDVPRDQAIRIANDVVEAAVQAEALKPSMPSGATIGGTYEALRKLCLEGRPCRSPQVLRARVLFEDSAGTVEQETLRPHRPKDGRRYGPPHQLGY